MADISWIFDMNTMTRFCSALILLITKATLLHGCAAPGEPLDSRLDRSSGLTVVSQTEVIVLARPMPSMATTARDYAYLGPVEINRMGVREHYLWLGIGSTLDRGFFGATLPRPTALHLVVDGGPMTLPLSGWNEDIETPPYTVSTPVQQHLRTRVSLDQLNRIANAASVDVHIVAGENASAQFELWTGRWSELAIFTDAVAPQP